MLARRVLDRCSIGLSAMIRVNGVGVCGGGRRLRVAHECSFCLVVPRGRRRRLSSLRSHPAPAHSRRKPRPLIRGTHGSTSELPRCLSARSLVASGRYAQTSAAIRILRNRRWSQRGRSASWNVQRCRSVAALTCWHRAKISRKLSGEPWRPFVLAGLLSRSPSWATACLTFW
jgi:hypothetical protein